MRGGLQVERDEGNRAAPLRRRSRRHPTRGRGDHGRVRRSLWTTYEGGLSDHSAGVVYEITADGKEKILHTFCSEHYCSDGVGSNDLIIDANGNLYGTTYGGGTTGNGVVFEITP